MRLSSVLRAALYVVVALPIACESSRPPTAPIAPPPRADLSALVTTPAVAISQVYGGGGNSGATFKNDFIELYNPGTAPVDLTGWSVQYASAAGTSWQVTRLTHTLDPGHYYLVKEAAGAGGTVDLPTPDTVGGIAMSATAGKVWLVATTTALTGACPGGAVDEVSYGTTASDCGFKTTATLSNTTAAFRKDDGCAFSGDLSVDFAVAAPAPRNTASPVHVCPGTVPVGPLDHLALTGPATVNVGASIQLVATPQDVNNQTVAGATIAWVSSDPSVASVNGTGLVTGVAASGSPVTITATAVADGITKSAAALVNVTTPTINWIDVSSSSQSFPPGFQTQLFTTARTASGGTIIPATFTFEALNPDIATIATVQNTGIITGVAGSATRPGFRITATPVGGGPSFQFTTFSIIIEPPVPAPISIYAVNDEFGDPTPASASDPTDFLIVRPQYTISYNETRGTPNWVSYELDARQIVPGKDRCNCFSADPLLPLDKQILTADYTNGGFDRGHMARSFDRTAGNVDNASTFYLTNIVPQTADLNQGVWAQFENALGDSAQGGRAVYIITGPLFSRSHGLAFLKNEGKVAIPDSTWKVALIGPDPGGVPFTRGDVTSFDALTGVTVLAVAMPNVAGVRNDPWQKYLTTVDRIEAATGYDFLSLLPVAFQTPLEAGDHGPAAAFTVSGGAAEGSPLTFDASTTTDPDLGRTDMDHAEALTYAWTFSDGTGATGPTVTKAFTRAGTQSATVTVTDAWGWPSAATQTLTVANVAPNVAPLAAATLLPGETYSAAGSFTDPGDETWSATVDYGDGAGAQPLALDGKTFQLSHTYAAAGIYTLGVSVDDGAAGGSAETTVTVLTPAQGLAALAQAVGGLARSDLNAGQVIALQAKVRAASAACDAGHFTACANALAALVNDLQGLVGAGQVAPGAAGPVLEYANRLIAALGGGV